MKIWKSIQQHHFFVYALFFAVQVWFSLRGKISYEAILYSVAVAASLFLAVLTLSGWGTKKPEQVVRQVDHQEEALR